MCPSVFFQQPACRHLYPGIEDFNARYNEFAFRNLDRDALDYMNTLWEALKVS